ncbi:F-box/WD repeat-containing protein 5 isoform X2 [Cimex lectularius]|uniref:F-box domain-containing protein n=1 Tax=Cimex lectularius TaxID=79782 RepID=A0A8I6SB92_CIMLE|nr:F-box/WD repeat-containing protein 5 isoform X2 [Cimex lectularius]
MYEYPNNKSGSRIKDWNSAPDAVILEILGYLLPWDVLRAGQTCRNWNRLSYDELLWKYMLIRHFHIDSSSQIGPGKTWYSEYRRLVYETPLICSEVLRSHRNEVLHVSFSHDGTMFATCSKDSSIIVWHSSHPVKMKYRHDMKMFRWKYTQLSQFNKSDTLLLVSGVHFGSTASHSGEIAVFSLQDGFNLQCRVGNKPSDIFGTWYSDSYLISGDWYSLGGMVSTTGLWLNKASQETESEQTPILNNLFRFYNTNASSIHLITMADCKEGCKLVPLPKLNPNPNLHIEDLNNTVIKPLPSEERRINDEEESDSDTDEDEELLDQPEKLLIFITGSKTYIPHQIGFKKIPRVNFPKVLKRGLSVKERLAKQKERSATSPGPNWQDYNKVSDKFDRIDHVMDLHGHIIGMCLSPDHRYLYVNCRSWPKGYLITHALEPPPIAQEIDIHIIDLVELCEVSKILVSHKAHTPNNECPYIYLDVSEEYVASGAENNHGYLWDRNYSICLARMPHADIVNSVAFNPVDSSMLVTTSDDFEIKVWRSKEFLDERIGRKERHQMLHATPIIKKC